MQEIEQDISIDAVQTFVQIDTLAYNFVCIRCRWFGPCLLINILIGRLAICDGALVNELERTFSRVDDV